MEFVFSLLPGNILTNQQLVQHHIPQSGANMPSKFRSIKTLLILGCDFHDHNLPNAVMCWVLWMHDGMSNQ